MSTLVLGTHSFSTTPDVNGQLVLVNTSLGGVGQFSAAVTGSRPAAGIAGNIFIDTTLNLIQRDNGTTWDTLGATGVTSITGTANQISASASTGAVTLSIASDPIIPGVASITLPSGTTAQRPGSPTVGMVRFNSTIGSQEAYESGGVWAQRVGVIDKTVVPQVVTTNATTNIINYTVPGGTLGTTNLLRIRLSGVWANASGATRTVTITVSYGGTTMWQDTSATLATAADLGWNMDLILASNNSTNAQTLNGIIQLGNTGAPTTGTSGDLVTDEITGVAILSGTAAVNSTTNLALVVSTAFSGTGITWTKYFHTIEKL